LKPLFELLENGIKFNWTINCEAAFQGIKDDYIMIHLFPFILAFDASPIGMEAILYHKMPDDTERPISFESRSLSRSEKNYRQIDKEAAAIYWRMKQFFQYCYGLKFVLITDHMPLTRIHPQKSLPTLSAP
jgi:hypothetical protein